MEEQKAKRAVSIHPSRMKLSEYERQDWVVTAEYGTEQDDVLQPEYWAHMSQQMRPYDHIEVRVDDGTWLMELLVLESSRSWARVHVLSKHNLTSSDVSQTQSATVGPRHKVEWKGPHLKHCVIRTSDSEIVKDGISDKQDAMRWMLNHEKTVA